MSKKTSTLTAAHNIKNHWPVGPISALFCAAIFLTGSFYAGIASAAEDDDGARWFEVELILFAHNDPQALDAEQWPEIEGVELPLEDLQELRLAPLPGAELTDEKALKAAAESLATETIPATGEAPADSDESVPTAPIAFQLLDQSEWQLEETAKRLQRSSRFEPLLHIAWRQPTYELARAHPVMVYDGMDEPLVIEEEEISETGELANSRIGPPNPRLIGTIKLSVARYLHLAADLIYRIPVTQQAAVPVPDFDLWYDRPYPILYEPQGPAYRLEEWQAMRGFRMLESRRMRSKVMHYLDHPFFGMVVLITPVELPRTEDSETVTP